ncbi:MAG: fibrobacter succinogenes major paralogous domain-containing protein [Prolixibacteraceae bacterium]|nr:fibrobacter succinogenes major paralogous domain-containing protein [Prolixibacteraceae bacterium]
MDLYTIKNEIENITSNLSAFNIRTTYDPLKRINQCIQYNSSYRKKNIERISIINRFNALVIEASLGKAFEKSPGIWSQDTCIVYIWKVKDGLAFTSLCPRTELFPKGIVPEVFKEIDFTPKEKRSLPTLRSKRIGNQEWLSENLNVAEFSNGDTIKMVLSDEEWKIACKNREPAWCYYENDSKNGNKYGKLYNWYAVNDNRLLAPVGWHIPSYYEWKELISFLGGSEIAGGKMKSQLNWSPGYLFNPGSNLSGLSCLPGGKRLPGGSFENEGRYGYWWSTEEDEEEENGWYKNVYLYYDDDSALQDSSNQGFGLSVRCIKDK